MKVLSILALVLFVSTQSFANEAAHSAAPAEPAAQAPAAEQPKAEKPVVKKHKKGKGGKKKAHQE